MAKEIFIQVRFSEVTEVGVYNDSLFFSEAEYQAANEEQIDALIAERIAGYLDNLRNRPPEPIYSEDELLEIKAGLQKEQVEKQNEIIEVDQKIIEAQQNEDDITPPSTPENLAVLKRDDTVIILGWDASTDDTGIVGYKVYRNDGAVFDVADTTFYDYKIEPKTEYIYQVSAIDKNNNESELSDELDTSK